MFDSHDSSTLLDHFFVGVIATKPQTNITKQTKTINRRVRVNYVFPVLQNTRHVDLYN